VEETEHVEETIAAKASDTTSTESKESDSAKGKVTREVVNESLPDAKVLADDLSLKANSLATNLDDEVNAKTSAVQTSILSAVTETNVPTNLESIADLGKPPVQTAPRQIAKPNDTKMGIAESLSVMERSPLNVNLPAELKVRF
jgi:hypothetical protein